MEWVRIPQGACLHVAAILWWDGWCRWRYSLAVNQIRSDHPNPSEARRRLQVQTSMRLTQFGLGLTEYAQKERWEQLAGKTAAELSESARRTNRRWNALAFLGMVAGIILVFVTLGVSFVRVTGTAPESKVAVLGIEVAAWLGALAGGWGGSRLGAAAAVSILGVGLPRVQGAMAGGLLGSWGGVATLEKGAIMLLGKVVRR